MNGRLPSEAADLFRPSPWTVRGPNGILRPDCYFLMEGNRIGAFSDLTGRELREGHNLEKLYRGGEFNE